MGPESSGALQDQSRYPPRHMWNTLAGGRARVGQTESGGGSEEGEERVENLGQTASEPHLKRWRKCIQPVGIQYQGSRPMSRGTLGWGGRKVCQLHNDNPPDLRAEETCDQPHVTIFHQDVWFSQCF